MAIPSKTAKLWRIGEFVENEVGLMVSPDVFVIDGGAVDTLPRRGDPVGHFTGLNHWLHQDFTNASSSECSHSSCLDSNSSLEIKFPSVSKCPSANTPIPRLKRVCGRVSRVETPLSKALFHFRTPLRQPVRTHPVAVRSWHSAGNLHALQLSFVENLHSRTPSSARWSSYFDSLYRPFKPAAKIPLHLNCSPLRTGRERN